MEFFSVLGDRIDAGWRRAHYAMPSLPVVAGEIVSRAEAHKHVDPMDIIRAVPTTGTLPAQRDLEALFGNPPITTYRNDRFSIDVIFWLDGSTAIHDHGFWGIWQVLGGSSLHCVYDFAVDRRYNDRFATGRLSSRKTEVLQLGDVRAIEAGNHFIHGLFHLDRPSVSLVVRTDRVGNLQHSYAHSGVAHSPEWQPPQLVRTLQCMKYVKSVRPEELVPYVTSLCRDADAHSLHTILRGAADLLAGDAESMAVLVDAARDTHGPLADQLAEAFSTLRRERALHKLRRPLTNADHRFFLGLLLNVRARDAFIDLIAARHPGEVPENLILRWTHELWGTSTEAQRTPLGIPPLPPPAMQVYGNLLIGNDVADLGGESLDAPAIAAQLRASVLSVVLPSPAG